MLIVRVCLSSYFLFIMDAVGNCEISRHCRNLIMSHGFTLSMDDIHHLVTHLWSRQVLNSRKRRKKKKLSCILLGNAETSLLFLIPGGWGPAVLYLKVRYKLMRGPKA